MNSFKITAPAVTPADHTPESRLSERWHYYRRIAAAYVFRRRSHLTFWHERPAINLNGIHRAAAGQLGEYYMSFVCKANHTGHFDPTGIPLLDYHGRIGKQYNPIAIAQYGLGNYNLMKQVSPVTPEFEFRRCRFLRAAYWLLERLESNRHGVWVWNHYFDWEYREKLKAPWYSALAQGQGLSLMVRAHQETRDQAFLDAASRVMASFQKAVPEGGVTWIDENGQLWFEEAIVLPPTHILNGFIWASWGLYDYWLHTGSREAHQLFYEAVRTLRSNLQRYDTGYWSRYELAGTGLPMLASSFYHLLHIVQLRVLSHLTGETAFEDWAERWAVYRRQPVNRLRALVGKGLFKLIYY